MKAKCLKNKDFYQKLLTIALPIALQNLISSSLNIVDNVMIGSLKETAIASVGLANQYFFLFILLLFGINSGCAIFIAQYWGKKDIKNIRKVLGISIIASTFLAIFYTSLAFFFPNMILRIFTNDIKIISLGSDYLKIVCFSYLFTAISFSYGFACRSVGKPKIPMYVSAIALIINTCLNYLFIFGHLGFPKMGVKGAAIATLISRSIELILLLSVIYIKKGVLAAKITELFDLSKTFVLNIFKTAIPVILNEAFWSLGTSLYSAAYARIGTEAIASVQIANTVQSLFMIVSMGIANACAIMIGNKIGADKREEAILYSKKFTVLSFTSGIVIGVILFLTSPIILSAFNISQRTYNNAKFVITIMSIFLPFKFYTTTLIVGILRSGGDTRFSLFLETGCVWLIGVPMAFLGALVWQLPIYWVVTLVSLEEVVKSIIGFPRVLSKNWIRSVI
ncbi:multidrug resistance protein MdtK [Clostridium tepidiprofundi DSM 19306]|uniref:Multidrug resistance protein MdtK n=1 Tax=Clostridium tepidiprofundi DSM 19306 TaxID=1121338 RepID=A0A151B4B1_9CLOT|nr:MATE family efflux transporter [Clostridium tepidiprofundi]KYH34761.1 multidrug resistance protein MdtK [Clostridium tepidiprofundi DSM 19306]